MGILGAVDLLLGGSSEPETAVEAHPVGKGEEDSRGWGGEMCLDDAAVEGFFAGDFLGETELLAIVALLFARREAVPPATQRRHIVGGGRGYRAGGEAVGACPARGGEALRHTLQLEREDLQLVEDGGYRGGDHPEVLGTEQKARVARQRTETQQGGGAEELVVSDVIVVVADGSPAILYLLGEAGEETTALQRDAWVVVPSPVRVGDEGSLRAELSEYGGDIGSESALGGLRLVVGLLAIRELIEPYKGSAMEIAAVEEVIEAVAKACRQLVFVDEWCGE